MEARLVDSKGSNSSAAACASSESSKAWGGRCTPLLSPEVALPGGE